MHYQIIIKGFILGGSDEVLHVLYLDLDVTVHPTHHHAGFVGVGF